jgi:DNA polymerase-3 subunit gamma/tau
MGTQAARFGISELTYAAETVNHALTEMSGATSPKLHLELMCAKVLVPSSDQTEVGSLARIERLERRIGVGGAASASAPSVPASVPVAASVAATETPAQPIATEAKAAQPTAIGAVTTAQFRDSWPNILTKVNKASKAAWMVAFALTVVDFSDDVLTLLFQSQKDLDSFKNSNGASDTLRSAILDVLGVQVKFRAQIAEQAAAPTPAAEPAPVVKEEPVVRKIDQLAPPAEATEPESTEAPAEEPVKSRNSSLVDESARYGESLLREMLGAEPIIDKNGGK